MQNKFLKLISYVEDIKERNNSSASSLVIIKDNNIILEHYSGYHSNSLDSLPITPISQFNIASARKSYLGLAISYALYEGKIRDIDDLAIDYLETPYKKIFAGTTIRHLVTHSHGLNQKEDGTIYREFNPGESWVNRGINVLMMSQLINELYGKSYPLLLKDRIFSQLGFKETFWHIKPNENLVPVIENPEVKANFKLGKSIDGTEPNLHTSTREFALWGNLHLNNGFVNGKQLVPKEVIQMATTLHSPNYKDNQLPKNGFFWYVQDKPSLKSEIGERVPKGSYQILGITGPTLLVIPEYNLVVSKMYNKMYNYGGDNYLHYLREFSNLVVDIFK
ncbi:serine hydrolase domain-containing protein [Gracilibacillus kekensis]|uniref:CubicO group peptidase, beta-lactamase class C family n=1 Tax=Gracilibacillus kekensis TaxID=1027249 RepID=A0A1M7PNH7_9BACI|nr:serine hydrolase domain-containing protein [Gracilibacillus kekensis]SHN18809.1 CubicO group peptidase, beta-lactamase class C family [Gracilibacillus kekensis]